MDFKKLTLGDITALRPYFEQNCCRICDCTIGCTFIWRDLFKIEYAIEDGILYLKADYFDLGAAFPPPRGEHSGEPYDRLIEHCRQENIPVRLCAVSKRNLDLILARYPHARYTTDRSWSDYLYTSESIRTLAGRKYSAQRNHIHRFERDNPDWSFERITEQNLDETREFFARSFDERQKESVTYTEGNLKTFEVLDNLELYGFSGGILRSDGKIIGASL
ncbi:MAG: DUF2156 domain-containing protein, partial [Oscillospiraceae bacterium]|nr:DUF2156 domain-containing protein [Oscillospiraceae bacterium]